MKVTEEQIQQVEARLELASRGPWVAHDSEVYLEVDGGLLLVCSTAGPVRADDAIFIASARHDLELMVEEVRRLRSIVALSSGLDPNGANHTPR